MTAVPPPTAVMTRELPSESSSVLMKDRKKNLRYTTHFPSPLQGNSCLHSHEFAETAAVAGRDAQQNHRHELRIREG